MDIDLEVLCLLISETFSNISLSDSSYKRPFIQGFWDGRNWVLDNGTLLVYTRWANGHPKINHDRHYIKFVIGKWKTSISSEIRPVFCSYKL